MKKSALLVIDVQDSFFHAPYWSPEGFEDFKSNVLQLIQSAKDKLMHVIYVLHADSDAAFQLSSGYVKPMDFLPVTADDVIITKHQHNAFTGTELEAYLQQNKITNLLISGIRTEQCCETTTRVARDMGYEVEYVMDATLTFPMKHPLTGRAVSAAEIQDKTALVLHNRFANVTTTREVIAV
ncbi:MAG: isochorismatase family protein [Coxiellaceae bacterium]|nr:isochorismatase family protein [Coxiellaceae bacterium]